MNILKVLPFIGLTDDIFRLIMAEVLLLRRVNPVQRGRVARGPAGRSVCVYVCCCRCVEGVRCQVCRQRPAGARRRRRALLTARYRDLFVAADPATSRRLGRCPIEPVARARHADPASPQSVTVPWLFDGASVKRQDRSNSSQVWKVSTSGRGAPPISQVRRRSWR